MRYRIPGELPAMGLAAIGVIASRETRRFSGSLPEQWLDQAHGLAGPRGSPRKEKRRMRLGRRLAKVLIWGLVLIVLITAGAAWFAYALVTDSETAERLIKAQAARFLPRSIVEMGRINIGILKGEVTVSHFHVLQRIDGQSFLTAQSSLAERPA